jgi:hypothetical protein
VVAVLVISHNTEIVNAPLKVPTKDEQLYCKVVQAKFAVQVQVVVVVGRKVRVATLQSQFIFPAQAKVPVQVILKVLVYKSVVRV